MPRYRSENNGAASRRAGKVEVETTVCTYSTYLGKHDKVLVLGTFGAEAAELR